MKTRMTGSLIGMLLAIMPIALNGSPLDLNEETRESISAELSEGTLELRIHGSSNSTGVLVGTYSVDGSTFRLKHFPVYAADAGVQVIVDSLVRDDLIQITGKISSNRAPIPHIVATKIELLETWVPEVDYGSYNRQYIELKDSGTLVGKAHAVSKPKGILVIESKDSIHPVIVRNKELLDSIIRNDTVEITYVKKTYPGRPAHLELAEGRDSLRKITSVMDIHEKPMSLKGSLARFPISPRMRIPVFAVQVKRKEFSLYYTLVNFRNPTLFNQINKKLGQLWDENEGTAKPERNISINPKIQIEVSGIGNILGENVANPQIIVQKISDIKPTIED